MGGEDEPALERRAGGLDVATLDERASVQAERQREPAREPERVRLAGDGPEQRLGSFEVAALEGEPPKLVSRPDRDVRRAARPRARDDRLEDRLGGVVLAAVDPAAAEREADLVLDPRVERAARRGEPALGARVAAGELVDVGEGEAPARGGLTPVGPVGEQDRAVQVDDDLVLRAAPGVEAGERERE